MRLLLLATFILRMTTTALSQSGPVGIFDDHNDIGNPAIQGSIVHNSDQSYNLKAGGYNIWFNRDEFHYAYNKVKGDFILTANVQLLGKGTDPHRKIGWMVRASPQEDAAHISATLHGDGLTVLQWRPVRGAYMRDPQDQVTSPKRNVQIVQLERTGKTFIMRVANPGEPLQEIARTSVVDMPDDALAGLFMCSHRADVEEEGKAWNVRMEYTVPDTHNGYRDGALSSRLEIMNVFDGVRTIIHQDAGRFEAPNWMPDGKRLLFNQGGSLYTIPI